MAMNWEQRLAALWSAIDDYREEDFLAAMDALVAELPTGSAVAAYERGSALDSIWPDGVRNHEEIAARIVTFVSFHGVIVKQGVGH